MEGLWKLDIFSELTWLVTWEDFLTFSHHESLKSYLISYDHIHLCKPENIF
jgi:hypothetical protein